MMACSFDERPERSARVSDVMSSGTRVAVRHDALHEASAKLADGYDALGERTPLHVSGMSHRSPMIRSLGVLFLAPGASARLLFAAQVPRRRRFGLTSSIGISLSPNQVAERSWSRMGEKPSDGQKQSSGRTPRANTATSAPPGKRLVATQRGQASSKRAGRTKKGAQLSLPRTGGWGGKRRGAGRKRSTPNASSRVTHAPRPVHKGRHPVHVTLRAKPGLPSFRKQRVQRLLAEVLRDQRRRRYSDDFRVIHYSIQANHLHLIVEADTERARGYDPLRSGISGLEIAVARRLNLMLRRKGKVWADRYHRRDPKTPKETRSGLAYVFDNYTHHGERSFGEGVLDLYSSACMFDGWEGPHFVPDESDRWLWPVCRARTWLLRQGYLVHGRLTITPTR